MNINGFSSSVSAPQPLGNRLDVTVREPATPQQVAALQTADSKEQVGSISGVLSDAENTAIARAFPTNPSRTYTMAGTTRTRTVAPGMHLDLQA